MTNLVFITGATSGIGKASAEIFARNSHRLIICGRRAERLDALKKELAGKYHAEVMALPLDVTDNSRVQEAIQELPHDWQGIDILVNNAGLALGFDPVQNGDVADWERMIDTNIKGLLYVSRAIMPGMISRRKGHIVNVGSVAGKEAYINGNVYCATKHAVDALTRSMRIDLLRHGIRVSQIAPGAVETEFALVRFGGDERRAKDVYRGYRPLSPADVANAIYFMCSVPEHVCINDMVIMPSAQANTVHWNKDE
jgi:3-hydroxy acid dehydrogenase / malonic semialdehyde reductase